MFSRYVIGMRCTRPFWNYVPFLNSKNWDQGSFILALLKLYYSNLFYKQRFQE